MRPTQSQGRPGTPVIPAGWEAGHRPVVEGTLTATASLRKPGTQQSWDPDLEQMVAVPLAPYATGAARVQALRGEARNITLADDTQVLADYLIVVPASVAPATGDLVTVTASGDPLLDGRVFVIHQVALGTERFERDLFCTLLTPHP